MTENDEMLHEAAVEETAPTLTETAPAANEEITPDVPAANEEITPDAPAASEANTPDAPAASEEITPDARAEEPEPISDEEADELMPPPPDYVGMTLHSGVAPMEMRFSQINSCYRRQPIAYRSFTYVNSVTMGVLSPEKYNFVADSTEAGLRVAAWNIRQAIRTVQKLLLAGKEVSFVTARCPASLVTSVDTYEWVKAIMEENNFTTPDKLCLEFPQSLLYEDQEKARLAILNLKLLKVRSLMTGCGADDCPLALLLRIPVDMVLLDPSVTALVCDRNKSGATASLITYLRSMQMDILADDVRSDDTITALSRADCLGYIPSPAYEGAVVHGRLRMTYEDVEALKYGEET